MDPDYRYHINEFHVVSDLPLPCDTVVQRAPPAGSQRPLVRVRSAALPREGSAGQTYLGSMAAGAMRFHRDDQGVLIGLGRPIRMHVDSSGRTITVDAEAAYLPHSALFVVGLGLALCTFFDGGIPLHAAGLESTTTAS
jgi:hypothetical protein